MVVTPLDVRISPARRPRNLRKDSDVTPTFFIAAEADAIERHVGSCWLFYSRVMGQSSVITAVLLSVMCSGSALAQQSADTPAPGLRLSDLLAQHPTSPPPTSTWLRQPSTLRCSFRGMETALLSRWRLRL